MGYDFLMDCEAENVHIREWYKAVYYDMELAERVYWSNPQECGKILRQTAEKIARIYNCFYEIGFSEEASLEGFLCYTESDEHNVMVSRFLSVVRKEQRDRLNKLRVLGDECNIDREQAEPERSYNVRMSQNAKRMMETMTETLKEMCRKINHREDLSEICFHEEDVPGRPEQTETEVKKQPFFEKLLRGKRKDKRG